MEPVWVKKKKIFPFESSRQLVNYINEFKGILVAINAEKIMIENAELTEIINSGIGYADGIGAVWAIRKMGKRSVKIAGVDLWLEIVKEFQSKRTFYLIGGTQLVIKQTVEQLTKDYPGINIVHFRNGFFANKQEEELEIERIVELKPDVVFVAMGSPRQELLMNRMKEKHHALYMGLGGSFDIYCGQKRRAPRIFIDAACEWLYRLLKEPLRIKRQVILVKFWWLLCLRKI